MKIQSIGNFYHPSFKSAENKQKEKKSFSSTEKAVYGISGAVALGIGAYFLLRRKGKVSAKNIIPKTEITPSKITANVEETKSAAVIKTNIEKPVDIAPENSIVPEPVVKKESKAVTEQANTLTIDNFKPYFKKEHEVIKAEHKNFSTITYKAVEGNNTYRDILVLNKENKLVKRITDFRNKNGKMWSRVYKGDETNILVNPNKLPKSRYDSTFLVKEFSGEARKPFGLNGEGTERLTRVAYPDGYSKTYQGFFNKNNKLHEYRVYYDKFDNSLGCFDRLHQAQSEYILKYDYAYKDGKLSGVAKQEILKDNNWYGIYQNNGFDAFPQYVDLKDGKGFVEFKGDLYIRKPEFDPENF